MRDYLYSFGDDDEPEVRYPAKNTFTEMESPRDTSRMHRHMNHRSGQTAARDTVDREQPLLAQEKNLGVINVDRMSGAETTSSIYFFREYNRAFRERDIVARSLLRDYPFLYEEQYATRPRQ